jgi:hypothetical protein
MNYQITVNMKQLIFFCTLIIFILLSNFSWAESIDGKVEAELVTQDQCNTLDLDFLKCRRDALEILTSTTSNCDYYIIGSIVIYITYIVFGTFYVKQVPSANGKSEIHM